MQLSVATSMALILRRLAQRAVSKDGRNSGACSHPSRRALRALLRMRAESVASLG
jgi:hypothetical protein